MSMDRPNRVASEVLHTGPSGLADLTDLLKTWTQAVAAGRRRA